MPNGRDPLDDLFDELTRGKPPVPPTAPTDVAPTPPSPGQQVVEADRNWLAQAFSAERLEAQAGAFAQTALMPLSFLLKGAEQTFTMIGAAISPLFYPEQFRGLPYTASPYPGGKLYKRYEEWEEPTTLAGVPSMRQIAAWLPEPAQRILAQLQGVSPEKYKEWVEEKPIGYEMGELGWKPTVEMAPLMFIPGMAPTRAALPKAGEMLTIKTGIAPKEAARLLERWKPTQQAGARLGKRLTEKVELDVMPTIEEIIAANYDRNLAAKLGEALGKIPFIGNIIRGTNPMLGAKTLEERGVIAWQQLLDVAESNAAVRATKVYAREASFKLQPRVWMTVKGLRIKTGTLKVVNVKPKKPAYSLDINAIAEFPDRYYLTTAQREELNILNAMLERQLALEQAAGVKVFPVALKEGQRYFPRFVQAVQGTVKEVRQGLKHRVGAKQAFQRGRWYEEVHDGILAGKEYGIDIRAAVEARMRAGNKAIADKQLADYLAPMGKLPRERIAIEIKARAWGAARQYAGIRQFQKVINRILRGETPTEMTLRAQERRFPELGAKLREALGKPKKLKALLKEAKALEPTLKTEYWAARRPAVRALARARVPILGKEGTINHAGLQGRIFPVETADVVNRMITKELTSSQVLGTIAKVNAVARMGQTAIDTGFTLIQGLLVLANRPDAWGKAFGMALKTLKNPRHMARFAQDHVNTLLKITRGGGAPFMSSEFTVAARAGGLLEKVPIVGALFKRFGAAFEGYLDAARVYLYEALEYRAVTPIERTALINAVDNMVGISSMRRLGVSALRRQVETNVLYAPRYYRAFVGFTVDAFQGGLRGDLARTALAKFSVAVPAFMSAVAVALGQEERIIPTEDKPIPEMFDPRTGRFMTVEIAGTHMGLGGVWIAGFRLLGSLTRAAQDDPSAFLSLDPHENPILRYPYGRMAPILSAVIDIVTGHNYLGERLDTPMDYLHEVIDKTFPFWLAGQITDVPKAGWEKGLAEWWGLRAWMVQYWEEARRMGEELIPKIPDEMIMDWQREKVAGGEKLTYDDLNNGQRAWLLENYAEYREAQERAWEDRRRRGTDIEVVDVKVRETLDAAYYSDLSRIAESVFAGMATIETYNDQSEYLRRIRQGEFQYRGLFEQYANPDDWERQERWLEENRKPEDTAYEQYMELRGNPPKVGGVPDWDAWKAQLDTFFASLSPEVRSYIEYRRQARFNSLPDAPKKLEQLIYQSEQGLDGYYAQEQGKARLAYRVANPQVDAQLFILGRVTRVTTVSAQIMVGKITSAIELQLPEVPVAELTAGAVGKPSTEELYRKYLEELR